MRILSSSDSLEMVDQEIFFPQTLREALAIRDRYRSDALVLAGGTILAPMMNRGIIDTEAILSLARIPADYIRSVDGMVEIGCLTSLSRLASRKDLSIVSEAAGSIHGWAVRNMGTIGGNVFAPFPAGDVATALLALDAKVVIKKTGGTRTIPLQKLYKGGTRYDLRENELLTAVRVPKAARNAVFMKLERMKAASTPILTLATNIELGRDNVVKKAGIAFGAVAFQPFRAKKAEQVLTGSKLTKDVMDEAAAVALSGVEPLRDAIATEWYRAEMAKVMLRRALEKVGSPR